MRRLHTCDQEEDPTPKRLCMVPPEDGACHHGTDVVVVALGHEGQPPTAARVGVEVYSLVDFVCRDLWEQGCVVDEGGVLDSQGGEEGRGLSFLAVVRYGDGPGVGVEGGSAMEGRAVLEPAAIDFHCLNVE